MVIIYIYFFIVLLSLLMAFPKLKEILRNKVAEGKDVELEDIDELREIKPILTHQLKSLFSGILFIITLPIFMLRMALISRFGISIVWKLPVDLYEIWLGLFIGYSFYISKLGQENLSITISSILTITMIHSLSTNMERKKGRLKILDIPEHKLSIKGILSEAILVIIGFASIFYSLSLKEETTFNIKLSVIDSIYYSFMVGTTVGFGHIQPNSNVAKILTICEAFLGFIFIVFLISTFMNIWTQKRIEEK